MIDWSRHQKLIADWTRPLEPGDGVHQDEVFQAEERLNCVLPLALREWYLMTGKREDLNQLQDRLQLPHQLWIENDYLFFYIENQHVYEWVIDMMDFDLEDPPVYVRHVDTKPWTKECDKLSDFLINMTAMQIVLGSDTYANGFITAEQGAHIAEKFERLPVPECSDHHLGATYYLNREYLIMRLRDGRHERFYVTAATKSPELTKQFALEYGIDVTDHNY